MWIPSDNRPAPLANAPIPLLADELCQMSFGERAALRGLLSELRPRLAVEVGTYKGGSLQMLASSCGHVHTLDLYDSLGDRAAFDNVTFHIGDSRLVLPELLRELHKERRAVDFVLVDGDHSAAGVREDLTNILESPTTASTMILLHDTMNDETRSGIELVGLSECSKVVYHELDFIPGYEFVGGHFDGQVWGGLGLVITGDRRSNGYGESPAQTRYRESFQLVRDARILRGDLDDVLHQLDVSQRWLGAIQASLSWRMTRPLRWAKRHLPYRRLTRR
jgi:hypothetical protein